MLTGSKATVGWLQQPVKLFSKSVVCSIHTASTMGHSCGQRDSLARNLSKGFDSPCIHQYLVIAQRQSARFGAEGSRFRYSLTRPMEESANGRKQP